jgi:trimeric autotransporter adhesin
MKRKSIVLCFLSSIAMLIGVNAFAQGTAFSYQGQLQNNGSPAHGTYNLQFSLYTVATGGAAVAGPVTTNGVSITNGLFAVTIDFGATVWSGATNWLQIGVETNGASSFSSLSPRQQIMPLPYAIFSEGANAAGLTGTVPVAHLPPGIVTNNQGTVTVSNLVFNGGSVVIYIGTNTLLVTDTNFDFFAGPGAGNVTCAGLGSFGNAASGVDALANIGDAVYDTANGYQALYSDSDASDNTADGAFALSSDTNGTANTATGFEALTSDTSGSYNTANGYQALLSGWTNSYNTANGALALWANWGGSGNTADGAYALMSDTTGGGNTADGYDALNSDNFGSENTAVGDFALFSTTTGSNNTAVGVSALSGNVYGWDNTAVGYEALQNPGVYAQGNTAVGCQALQNNIGGGNTANGYLALMNNGSGGENLGDGPYALWHNTSGSLNIAVGYQALFDNVSGSGNTALGWQALPYLGYSTGVGGASNIAVGCESGSAFIGNESHNIDIGNPGVVGENGIIRIGTGGVQSATYLAGNCYASSFNSSSDRNLKENFATVSAEAVLDKVAVLPISRWNFKQEKTAEHIGPTAQDFHAAFGLNGKDDTHISVVDEGGVALAAIQGLNQKLEEQNKEKDAELLQLKQSIAELQAMVSQLTQKNGK